MVTGSGLFFIKTVMFEGIDEKLLKSGSKDNVTTRSAIKRQPPVYCSTSRADSRPSRTSAGCKGPRDTPSSSATGCEADHAAQAHHECAPLSASLSINYTNK